MLIRLHYNTSGLELKKVQKRELRDNQVRKDVTKGTRKCEAFGIYSYKKALNTVQHLAKFI